MKDTRAAARNTDCSRVVPSAAAVRQRRLHETRGARDPGHTCRYSRRGEGPASSRARSASRAPAMDGLDPGRDSRSSLHRGPGIGGLLVAGTARPAPRGTGRHVHPGGLRRSRARTAPARRCATLAPGRAPGRPARGRDRSRKRTRPAPCHRNPPHRRALRVDTSPGLAARAPASRARRPYRVGTARPAAAARRSRARLAARGRRVDGHGREPAPPGLPPRGGRHPDVGRDAPEPRGLRQGA